MRSLAITAENFENQRQTVMEERRQSYENRPYMNSRFCASTSWPTGTTGPTRTAPSATWPTCARHARTCGPSTTGTTRPTTRCSAFAGDFEPAEAMVLVRQHFGMIAPRRAPAWVDPGFTPQTAERTASMTDPLARLPAFHLAYHIPARRSPDHYALEILTAVLGAGESSRLYQELVKTREIASSIEVETEDRRGPDLLAVWCVVGQGHTGAEAREVIYRQLDASRATGITARELDKARNQYRTAFVFGLQSNLSRARRLAEFELYDGNAALLRTELDRYLAVTPADVQRVAREYFRRQNRTVLDVLTAPPRPRRREPRPMIRRPAPVRRLPASPSPSGPLVPRRAPTPPPAPQTAPPAPVAEDPAPAPAPAPWCA
jgi:zinc protease